MDGFSLDPEADGGGGSTSDTGGNPVDAAYNDASGPPPGAVPTEEPGIYQNPDGSFWFAPVTVTETPPPAAQPSSFSGMGALNELFGMGSAQAGELPTATETTTPAKSELGWFGWTDAKPYESYPPYVIRSPEIIRQGPIATADQLATYPDLIGSTVPDTVSAPVDASANAASTTTPAPVTTPPVVTNPTFTDASGAQYLRPYGAAAQDIALSPVDNSGINISPNTTVTTDFTGIGNVGNTGNRSGPTMTGDVSAYLDSYYGNRRADALGDQTSTQTPDNTAAQPNVTLGYTAPTTGVQVGGSQDLVGQFTVNGPVAYKNGLGTPYGNTIPLYDEPTTTIDTATNQTTTPLLTVAKPVIAPDGGAWNGPVTNLIGSSSGGDTTSGNTINTLGIKPLTVAKPAIAPDGGAWTGPVTNLIGSGSGGDTAMSSTGYDKNANTEKLWSDLTFGTGSPIGADGDGISSATPIDPTTAPTIDTTSATSGSSPSFMRKYLGASNDPYHYGFGAERQYYGSAPAAAKGGYFDAEQYFADGGLVQPLSPPTTPLVPTQPTMAFTDGVGAVGSIAQPPGLAPSDAFGFDEASASPMAPSVAAAVPSMQPGLATLATPNVNANPVPSPIAQNPNVGYALGNSPLSNLARS
jgi:hypothetical protein